MEMAIRRALGLSVSPMQRALSVFGFKPKPKPLPNEYADVDRRPFEVIKAERETRKALLIKQWHLPAYPVKHRGAPTYQERWIRGLYLVAQGVSHDKIDEPPADTIVLICPSKLKVVGFDADSVVQYYTQKEWMVPDDEGGPGGEAGGEEAAARDDAAPAHGDEAGRECTTPQRYFRHAG